MPHIDYSSGHAFLVRACPAGPSDRRNNARHDVGKMFLSRVALALCGGSRNSERLDIVKNHRAVSLRSSLPIRPILIDQTHAWSGSLEGTS